MRHHRNPWTMASSLFLLVIGGGCGETPIAPEGFDPPTAASSRSSTNSEAPFPVVTQGFNHGTEGWYGEETPSGLGWCGEVDRVDQGSGLVGPSAGRAYATVTQTGCNDLWTSIFGPGLRSGPWAPGPNFANFSTVWPSAGFAMELDIYLDPTWTAASLDPGTYIFGSSGAFPDFVNTTVFTYAVSVRDLASPADAGGSFRYFAVPVASDDGTLVIFGHEVTDAGWYTFRHVFDEVGGHLTVDFELVDRSGGVLSSMSYATTLFGISVTDLVATDFGSGYMWFVSISPGLEVPIDEQKVRPGE